MDLKNINQAIQDKFKEKKQILSFEEYIEKVKEAPWRHIRSSPQFVKDCFDHFGSKVTQGVSGKIRRWKLFDRKFEGKSKVFGQEEVQNKIYSHISAFAKRGRSDKLILLHGPNATAKSSIVGSIMSAMEEYSHQEEGSLYTFNWVFNDSLGKGNIGFKKKRMGDSLAHSDPKELHFKIRSGLKDNPLLLIPREQRIAFLEEAFAEHDREFDKNHPICNQEMSHKFKEIYDELLENSHGDWSEVLQQVQVCRFFISKRYRTGAVTIEPQRNVDAQSKALTLERDFDVPNSLKRANLHECYGDLIDGSRGVIEYSDFFKRPLEVNKYLLTTSENGTVSLSSTFAHLDVILFATSNETHLGQFKAQDDFPSFKGRMELIKVPYLKQWDKEANIYRERIENLSRGKHVSPHTADFIGLWSVLTRLKKPLSKNYNEKLGKVVIKLGAIEKANLYATGKAPDRLRDEERTTLLSGLPKIVREFDDAVTKFEGMPGMDYEGRRGASAREVMSMINEASLNPRHNCMSALTISEEIKKLSKDTSVYDFLRLDGKKTYGEIKELTEMAEKEFRRWVIDEVRDSMNLVSKDEYLRVFKAYIRNVNAWKKGEKIENPQSGRMETPSENFLLSVEKDLGVEQNTAEFRSSVIMRAGKWKLENMEKDIEAEIEEIFRDLLTKLKGSYYERFKKSISKILENLKKFGHEDWKDLNSQEQEEVTDTLLNMKERYKYCDLCAKELIIHIINSRDLEE